jgi:transmembrane sensor
MEFSKNRIAYLLEAFSQLKATNEEELELFDWVAQGNEQPIKEHIEKLVSGYKSNDLVPCVDWEHLYQRIMEESNTRNIQPMVRKMLWTRWAAAAAVILLLGVGYYLLPTQKEQKVLAGIPQQKTYDIAPPNTVNAVLTLSNGQKIILDSTGNGTVAMQGSVNVVKMADGQISYQGTSNAIAYNTLSNPRGSKVISLTLGDGSKVWLNAASTLKYPTAFVGKERKVEITGEAYFEVAHNPAMPFRVSKGGTSVQVLGTHFNVNAYDDESSVNVTLLEGSVSLSNANRQLPTVIKPGQQAKIAENGDIQLANDVDVDEVMAWKNGLFSYKGADIESIMRQVSRWYNVEVVFEKPVQEKFYAEVSRNTSVTNLLKMLEATKAVHFKIEGKTITVMP